MRKIFSQNLNQRITGMLLLLTLHIPIIAGIDAAISRSIIIAHMGLFLIWQPIWRGDQRLNWQNVLVFVTLMGGFIVWLDWWLLTGWVLLLIGLTGGRLPRTNQERNINLVILFFLFIELLINCATNLFSAQLDNLFLSITNTGLFMLPLLILLLPQDRSTNKQEQLQVDLFGAITTALLASLLLLGSIINSHPMIEQDYGTALVQTFLFIGALILLISWLLSPRTGFSGLTDLWTQSLLNIGTPFERWINDIASLKGDTNTPEEFLDQATYQLLTLPMIDGVIWNSTDLHGRHGIETKNKVCINSAHLNITIMTSNRIGATLLLHFKLLVRIIDHFYTAKLQEHELARQAKMQAIYETGARITHDIKNILQSFHNITSIIGDNTNKKSDEIVNMLQRQLPTLTQRLDLALDKLQHSSVDTYNNVNPNDWWHSLKSRYGYSTIIFEERIQYYESIPEELFDRITENLVDNALYKANMDPRVSIVVRFIIDEHNLELSVTDTGEPVPASIEKRIFKEPLNSANGFGIGLLQSAEMANKHGYSIFLANNIKGNITFKLCKNT